MNLIRSLYETSNRFFPTGPWKCTRWHVVIENNNLAGWKSEEVKPAGAATTDGHHSWDGATLHCSSGHSFCVHWGGPTIQPYGTDNSPTGPLPSTSLPTTTPSSHQILHSNCFPWKPGGVEEEKRKERGKKKEPIVGSPHSSWAYTLFWNNKLWTTVYEERGTTVKSSGGLAHRSPIQTALASLMTDRVHN